MKRITSLFDFFEKVKTDKRYETLAIIAYQRSGITPLDDSSFDKAKKWLNGWVEENKGKSCERMVSYLNDQIKRVPNNTGDVSQPTAPPIEAAPPAVVAQVTPATPDQEIETARRVAEEELIQDA